MVCAEQQCTNHANPSLRSGADVKGQANVRRTLARSKGKKMKKQLLSFNEQLLLEQNAVEELIKIFSNNIDTSVIIYSDWNAKDVLGHITYWHLGFARNLSDAAFQKTQNPFKGSLTEVNERGVKEMENYSIEELITKIREAQIQININIGNKNVDLIEYKKGSRPYSVIEHLEVTRRHITWHIKDLKKKYEIM